MKIHQLENGVRFEYEGETYIKTGPLFATGKNGPRLIPKYALLTPLGEAKIPMHASTGTRLTRASVLNAFEAFFTDCKAMLHDDHQSALESCRERFLKDIDSAS